MPFTVNSGFLSYFYNQVSDTEWCEADELLKDVLSTRDESEILFADGSWLGTLTFKLSYIKCSDESCMTSSFFGLSRVLMY